MNPYAACGIGATGAILLFLLTLAARHLWHRAQDWASRRIEAHMVTALAQPIHGRYRDLDDEYRALVLAEHNNND